MEEKRSRIHVDTDDQDQNSESSIGNNSVDEQDHEDDSGSESDDEESDDESNEGDDRTSDKPMVTTGNNFLSSEVKVNKDVFDLAFHPTKNIFASALISGEVKLFEFTKNETPRELLEFAYHKKPCRGVQFSEDGNSVITTSKDANINIIDLDSGSLAQTVKSAHSEPINALKVINNNLLASGDDGGVIKLWDLRSHASIAEFSECKDYISDMDIDSDKKHLLCTSGDGTLAIYNVKSRKLVARSDQMDDELLSLAIIKDGRKVICGGSEGTLHIFSWGQWGDISDRFPGQPLSIDTICPITEGLICTGSMDGSIRMIHVQPNKFIGHIGSHSDLPIEKLRLNHDGTILGSCSNEEIKLWRIEEYCETINMDDIVLPKGKGRKRKLNEEASHSTFFDDL